jgi:hypothetical protein
METLVKTWNYGNYKSENYGSSRAVRIGDLTLYFSYKTIVAFRESGHSLKIVKNMWSTTTGRHLNCLDRDKERRLEYSEFQRELKATLRKYGLVEQEEAV